VSVELFCQQQSINVYLVLRRDGSEAVGGGGAPCLSRSLM